MVKRSDIGIIVYRPSPEVRAILDELKEKNPNLSWHLILDAAINTIAASVDEGKELTVNQTLTFGVKDKS